MGVLSDKPQYYQPSDKPGPKNGHHSEPHPQYASVFLPMKEQAAPLWANGTVEMIKQVFREAPPAIPEGCPEPDRDIKIQYTKAPARDGALLELKVYQSVSVQSNAALVFRMHGGGWTVGGHEIEEAENRFIAGLGNVVVISVDYRMAPEFPFPYALNDSYDVLLWLKRNPGRFNINSEKIILVGSSAGANLASIVAIKARDEGVTGIVGQVLSIPVTCHPKFFDQVPNKERYELLSYAQNHDAALVDSPAMEWFWDCYVGKNPSPDPMHSPLLSTNLRGLPPAIVLVAGKDPLRDEGIAYGEALKAAGVPTELRVYSGLPHGWHMGFSLKESKDYYDRVLAFIKERVANGRSSKL